MAALLCLGCASASRPLPISTVSPGIFMGPRPRKPADFDGLKQQGIRTILSLEKFPWHNAPERRLAQDHVIVYLDVPILASPLEPSERTVKEALLTLADPSLRPIYIHCLLSEDRTALIVGLYRIYYEGWPAEAAWKEMLRRGFHDSWQNWGFKTYFWNHTQKPSWAAQFQGTR